MSFRQVDVFPSEEFAKGYVAGFFDGEGSVGLYFQENRPKPVISITNCHWHILNYLHALVLPLLEIDVCRPKYMQIRISSWEAVKNFIHVFKDLCIVKREELEFVDQAVKLHQKLVNERKGRKIYSQAEIEAFRKIANEIKAVKRKIPEHGRYMSTRWPLQ